jgi:glycosyltransferase involved in cell wall biosynthesis
MVVAGEWPHGAPPLKWAREWPELVYIQSLWPFTRRGMRWWRAVQTPYALWRCLRLVRRHKVESIVAVFPDERLLLAAYLCARLTGRRFFPYFHNTYVENRRGWKGVFARWLQARVFARAEHVFVMSEGMSELYRQRYPTLEQSPLVHSFNHPLPSADVPETVASPLRIVLCGNVNASCNDAVARFGEAVAGCPNARLTVYSGTNPDHLRSIGLVREGVEHLVVSADEVLGRLAQADVLLLAHGLTGPWGPEEYQTIFPTKTIDYLISGRPILAHTPPDCFLTRFLRKHDCALIVDQPDVGALREAIERLRTDYPLRRRLVQNALAAARPFQAREVAAELRRWIA